MITLKELGRLLGKQLVQTGDASALTFVALAEAGTFDNVTILENAAYFNDWTPEWTGKAGTILMHEGLLYKSKRGLSKPDPNSKPDTKPHDWEKIGDPNEEWPPWSPALCKTDGYPSSAKTSHKNKHWINTFGDGNVTEPGVSGWTEAV